MGRLRRHLTYANVVSTMCLFIVLGGTSYGLAKGVIGSGEIRNNSVRSKDVRNKTLRNKDVRPDALRGDRIVESSLGTVPSAVGSQTSALADDAKLLQGKGPAAFVPAEKVVTSGSVVKLVAGPTNAEANESVFLRSGPFGLKLRCYHPSGPGTSLSLVVQTTEPGTVWHRADDSIDNQLDISPPEEGVLGSNSSSPSSSLMFFSLEAPSGAAVQGFMVLGLNILGSDCSVSAFGIA